MKQDKGNTRSSWFVFVNFYGIHSSGVVLFLVSFIGESKPYVDDEVGCWPRFLFVS